MANTNETKLTERTRCFIEALTKLCEEYGASIGGCGCCGSPWLTVLEEDGTETTIDRFHT